MECRHSASKSGEIADDFRFSDDLHFSFDCGGVDGVLPASSRGGGEGLSDD